MKHEKAPLKTLFDALREEVEPIDLERQARTLNRFRSERIFQSIEGAKPFRFGFVDRDADARPTKKPHVEEPKPKPKDRPRRS
jgi:hypothetical protein